MTCTTHHHACECREAEFAELEKLVRPWIDANGVHHRHAGIDWPSADKCELCQLESRIAELETENEQLITAFAHYHEGADDFCKKCELYLTHSVHIRWEKQK